jgi:hypothetical protein
MVVREIQWNDTDGSGKDGNNNIFSIAFALVERETAEGWSFFLKNLRLCKTPILTLRSLM